MIRRKQKYLTKFTSRICHSDINDIGLWYCFSVPIPKSNIVLGSHFLICNNPSPRSSHVTATEEDS